MSDPNTAPLPFNSFRSLPSLKDLLDIVKRDIFITLNCHSIGTIQEVTQPGDFPIQTVSVSINYQRTILNQDGLQVPLDYPILADVPVISLGGGATQLTFPIASGDQCLVLFNDRDMDNWMKGARSGQVNSPRMHSFSDGVALVGLNSLSSYDTVRALLTNGTVKVGINPQSNKVLISNGTSLGTILSNFFSTVSASTTAAQIAAAAATALPQIQALLE